MLKAMRQWFDEMNKKGDIQQILNRSSKPKNKPNGEKAFMEIDYTIDLHNKSLGFGYEYNGTEVIPLTNKALDKIFVALKADNNGGFIIYDTYPKK